MSRRALAFAAACAFLSAVTTFLLWLLPRLYAAPDTFEQSIELHANPFYLARLWVNFIHIFLALVAYGAAAWLLRARSTALAGFGFLWFCLWGFTELLGVTMNIFAVNATWRSQFAAATPEVQEVLRTNLLGFAALWDAMFFLLLVAFLLGCLCYGFAAARAKGVERLVGILFLLAVPLTAAIMLGGYTSIAALDPIAEGVYPVLQPISRGLLGYWLWSSRRVETPA
jgi:hypothetical protein